MIPIPILVGLAGLVILWWVVWQRVEQQQTEQGAPAPGDPCRPVWVEMTVWRYQYPERSYSWWVERVARRLSIAESAVRECYPESLWIAEGNRREEQSLVGWVSKFGVSPDDVVGAYRTFSDEVEEQTPIAPIADRIVQVLVSNGVFVNNSAILFDATGWRRYVSFVLGR